MRQIDPDDYSPAMTIAFSGHDSGKTMRLSFCIALYAVLILIWMPGFSFSAPVFDVGDDTPPTPRVTLKPPPEKPLEQVVVRQMEARSVPMPDTTPDEPEPLIEPDPVEEIDMVTTEDWVFGIPEHAPEPKLGIVNEHTIGLESPIFLERVPPGYPEMARRLRIEGYVILEAVLRTDGTVDEIRVVRGLGKGRFGFEDAAAQALAQWTYLPGKLHDKAVDVRMTLRVDFQLN